MSLSFDNQHIDISGTDFESFKRALLFFFPHPEDGPHRLADTVKSFAIDPKKGMILFWYPPDGESAKTTGGGPVQKLPYEMKYEAAVQFAWHWLQSDEAKKMRGREPDHDGDNGVAWRVYNEAWTHVDNFSCALVGIQPIWAMYGK